MYLPETITIITASSGTECSRGAAVLSPITSATVQGSKVKRKHGIHTHTHEHMLLPTHHANTLPLQVSDAESVCVTVSVCDRVRV